MAPPTLTVHVDPAPGVTEPLSNALREYNEAHVGTYRREHLAVVAEDEDGAFLGGVQGVLLFGWLYVERLWVAEERRGQGTGAALLGRIERAAAERGARRAALLSATWQAPEFYRKQGYERVASFELTLPSSPADEEAANHLLVKELEPPGAAGGGPDGP